MYDPTPPEISTDLHTLSLHDALPILAVGETDEAVGNPDAQAIGHAASIANPRGLRLAGGDSDRGLFGQQAYRAAALLHCTEISLTAFRTGLHPACCNAILRGAAHLAALSLALNHPATAASEPTSDETDRKHGVSGKKVSVRVDLGCRRINKKKTEDKKRT